jgi:hypothetical protein
MALRNFVAAALLLVAPIVLSAAPLKVFTGGSVETIAGKLAGKGEFEFAPTPSGFAKPGVSRYATLEVPKSIRSESREHNVQVGVVLSAKGKVLATCIMASDCPELESPAERQVHEMGFVPAKVDGVAVASFLVFPVSYRYCDPQ